MPRSRSQMDRTGEPYVDWVKTNSNRLRINIKCYSPELIYTINAVAQLCSEDGDVVTKADHERIQFSLDVTSQTIQFKIEKDDSELALIPIVPLDSSDNSGTLSLDDQQDFILRLTLLDVKNPDKEYDAAKVDLQLDSDGVTADEVKDA